jgi:hypothetical protein
MAKSFKVMGRLSSISFNSTFLTSFTSSLGIIFAGLILGGTTLGGMTLGGATLGGMILGGAAFGIGTTFGAGLISGRGVITAVGALIDLESTNFAVFLRTIFARGFGAGLVALTGLLNAPFGLAAVFFLIFVLDFFTFAI